MRLLVTGGTGFLGRHVLRWLGRQRPDLPITVFTRGKGASLPAGIDVVRYDIEMPDGDPFELAGRPTHLIHLAWSGLPNYREPFHFDRVLPAQLQFLRTLVAGGLRRMTVTGTCLEYGMKDGALDEAHPADPQVPYAIAKDSLRRMLTALRETSSFELNWLRLFYMYGEGQMATSLLSQLDRAIDAGRETFDMSPGDQLRDYLPVETVAEIICRIGLGTGEWNPLNCCSGQPVSVRSLVEARLAQRDVKMRLNLGHYPYAAWEPMAFWGCRRRLDRALGTAVPIATGKLGAEESR